MQYQPDEAGSPAWIAASAPLVSNARPTARRMKRSSKGGTATFIAMAHVSSSGHWNDWVAAAGSSVDASKLACEVVDRSSNWKSSDPSPTSGAFSDGRSAVVEISISSG